MNWPQMIARLSPKATENWSSDRVLHLQAIILNHTSGSERSTHASTCKVQAQETGAGGGKSRVTCTITLRCSTRRRPFRNPVQGMCALRINTFKLEDSERLRQSSKKHGWEGVDDDATDSLAGILCKADPFSTQVIKPLIQLITALIEAVQPLLPSPNPGLSLCENQQWVNSCVGCYFCILEPVLFGHTEIPAT